MPMSGMVAQVALVGIVAGKAANQLPKPH